MLALLAGTLAAGPAFPGDWERDGLKLVNRQADFEIGLIGYLQFHGRHYAGWESADPVSKPLRETLDVRRARPGLELGWRKLSAEWDFEWAGPANELLNLGEPPYDTAEMKDLKLRYEFHETLALTGGHFKIPVSPEFLTSSRKTDFVERSMLANSIGVDREWGLMASGEVWKKRLEYSAGVFEGDGRLTDTRAGTTFAARLVGKATEALSIAGSFSTGDVEADPDGPGDDPSPKGFEGRSPTGFRFYERKYVDGRRLRWGLDAALTRGSWSVKGEWLQGREERRGQSSTFTDLPVQVASGWSFTASWILTGEKKARTLEPERSLPRGPGLVELAARYEEIRFDDAGPDAGFEGAGDRARNIRPGGNRVIWGGVSWLPTPFMRLYADVLVERYLDPLLAPEPPGSSDLGHAPHGRGNYVTFIARLQFMVP
jgi:phosphate-selective porin